MGDADAAAVCWELLARAQTQLLAETQAPAELDSHDHTAAERAILGGEFRPCRTADDVAVLLTAMGKYPEGMHNRARRIAGELHAHELHADDWCVERLLARVAERRWSG